nr:NAD-glutamate dehydrogenase [Streptomyces nigrescens]
MTPARARLPARVARGGSNSPPFTRCTHQLLKRKANVRYPSPRTAQENGWTCSHSVIEVVTDDMPFLVDAVPGRLGHRRLGHRRLGHRRLGHRRLGFTNTKPVPCSRADRHHSRSSSWSTSLVHLCGLFRALHHRIADDPVHHRAHPCGRNDQHRLGIGVQVSDGLEVKTAGPHRRSRNTRTTRGHEQRRRPFN